MIPLYWSIMLLTVALILVALELFVPSGGMLGFLAALSCAASIFMAFQGGPASGWSMLLAATLLIPAALAGAIKVWPHTPLGKRVIQARPAQEDVLPERPDLRRLIGQRGVARSKMLPAGIVLIAGQTFDAVSQGMAVDPGQEVEVVDVSTNRIVVRPVQRLAEQGEGEDVNDLLSQPLDNLGLGSLDEPTV